MLIPSRMGALFLGLSVEKGQRPRVAELNEALRLEVAVGRREGEGENPGHGLPPTTACLPAAGQRDLVTGAGSMWGGPREPLSAAAAH